jgi:hypothetical protein
VAKSKLTRGFDTEFEMREIFVIFILLILDVPCFSLDKNGHRLEFFDLAHLKTLLWMDQEVSLSFIKNGFLG